MIVVIWDDEAVARLTKLRMDGLSQGEIAKQMGISRNAVVGKLNRLGVKIPTGLVVQPGPKPKPKKAKPEIKRDRNRFVPTRTYVRAPAKPMPKPAPEPIACEPRNLTILELQSGHCRWIGERSGLDTTYCAADVKSESSYCPAHHALVYVKPQDRRPGKRQSDVRREGGGKSAALAFLNE